MKNYCNMQGNFCRDVFSIPDDRELEECMHPAFLPMYINNQVPDYVKASWVLEENGIWRDRFGILWPEGIPSGPTPADPNYTGPWPIPNEEEPDTPEEQSE